MELDSDMNSRVKIVIVGDSEVFFQHAAHAHDRIPMSVAWVLRTISPATDWTVSHNSYGCYWLSPRVFPVLERT